MRQPPEFPRRPQGYAPGDTVISRAWKYDGYAHWVVPGVALGSDRFGEWIHQPAGSLVARPGMAFTAANDAVVLVPAQGEWIATFHTGRDRNGLLIYIDLSTRIGWAPLRPSGWEVHSVDMDLDVVEREGRGVYLDDEDEFAEHAEAFGYPPELAAEIERQAQQLLAAVAAHEAPFDGTADAWAAARR